MALHHHYLTFINRSGAGKPTKGNVKVSMSESSPKVSGGNNNDKENTAPTTTAMVEW
jgi:hypothetical protein